MKFNNRNVSISPKALIGKNVRIGDNTIIYDNVEIADNTVIADGCVIGEPLSTYYDNPDYENPRTIIGANSLIRSFTIIYAGSEFGDNFSTGHRVTIREGSLFGRNCRVGTLSDIQGNVQFGNYCWLHSNVHIGQKSRVGSYVMIYPYVVLTNDPTPPSNDLKGVSIDDFAQISVFSVILPGVRIGKHALVGANSTVGRNVEDYMLVLGSPAKPVKRVDEIKSRETGESHYPWPQRFERGMPWEGIGYLEWIKSNEK